MIWCAYLPPSSRKMLNSFFSFSFPELPYLPYIAIENIYNGTNTPWPTRLEQSKMRTTILNIDNSLDMTEVVYNMYEINLKALCDAIPDDIIYIVEKGICL